MTEQDEWEQIKREGTSWLDRWMNQTEAEFRAVRQHVKARGHPQGWTENEPEEVWAPEGARVVIVRRVEND